jgi:glycosyltransferase involved in cell wall biosynthesis
MNIIIASTKIPFVTGGAELLAENLHQNLKNRGHNCDIVTFPFKWYPPEKILDCMLTCGMADLTESNGRRVDMLICLKFPVYLINHPNKVIWLLHQHRTAYDFWDNLWGDLIKWPEGKQIRKAIQKADNEAFKSAKKIFTLSNTVSQRLRKFNHFDSKPLYHPPPNEDKFYCNEAQDYFFFPSRITPPKRQLLVVKALKYTKLPVKVVFTGSENSEYLKEIKQVAEQLDGRAIFTDHIDDRTKLSFYATSLGVIFPTYDEDYGYITLEAILSKKPVITCEDSGGPLEFIKNNYNGIVVKPEPEALAAAMDFLWENRQIAQQYGNNGYNLYKSLGISWQNTIGELLA